VACDLERPLAPAVAADALLALLELSATLAPRGIKPAVHLARVPEDGSAEVRVPVVPAYEGMHVYMREHHRWDPFWGLAAWVRGHGVAGPEPWLAGPSLRDFGVQIATHASDPARAR